MEVKALSRKMYEGLPAGSTLFFVDKIGLRIPTRCIVKEALEPFKMNNTITIVTWGDTSQIFVHAEFEPKEKHLGKRCLDAICYLMAAGVFDIVTRINFSLVLSKLYTWILINKDYSAWFLSIFFILAEWEWTWDFLDIKAFAHINTDLQNPKSMRAVYKTTHYSKDNREKKRIKVIDGVAKKLSKGRQTSFVKVYDKGVQLEMERTVNRVELDQQGKNRLHLSMDLLNGSAEEAFDKSLPTLKKRLDKVIDKGVLVVDDF